MLRQVCAVCAAAVTCLSTSCGSREGANETAVNAVDSRFESADAIVRHFNQLTSTDSIDTEEFGAMLYAENEKQRTFIDLYRFSLTTIDLDREMLNRFDEVFDEELIVSGLERRFTQQARLVEQTADRARAVAVDWLGDEWTLQFVRIGSRWWISGYTFEHDSNWFEFDAELAELLPCLRLVEGPTRTVCRDLATRIKRGDFQSPDEARQAYLKTFVDYARNNGAAFRPLEDYIRSHPDQRDKIIMLGMEAMVELSR